jgi:hypothetical protein
VQKAENASIGDSVEHEFSLTTRLNQALGPQHPKLLRETGLLNARELLELPHGTLALRELTQQDQSILIGHGLQKGSRKSSGLPDGLDVEGFRGH